MKNIISLMIFTCLYYNSFSQEIPYGTVSASPYPTQIAQPDGEMIDIKVKGNGYIHYLETIDGYTILKDDQDGMFKYMVSDGNGDLLLTDVVVHNSGNRNQQELNFLSQIEKNLRFSGKTLKQKTGFLRSHQPDSLQYVFPSTGTRRALLILIDFPDQNKQHTVSEFNDLANQSGYNVNGQSGSFRDYYRDISYNALTINTDVRGWYTANNNKAFYGAEGGNPRALVREAVDAAQANGVNFSLYDGDNDGKVDVVMIIHSGRGEEESGVEDDIWSHSSSLGNLQVSYDGVLISDYIIQAERQSGSITNIGVLCHEFGHALGIPDLYDTDGSSKGIGRWGLMASGTWNNNGKTPAQMCAWSKIQLGWITPTVLSSNTTVSSLPNINASATCYRINTSTSGEYFLISNRQKIGWDNHLPGEGLAIWHIDDNQSGNQNENRYKVDLEQADDARHLNNDVNTGDNGDLFPGSANNTFFDDNTNPNARLYNGSNSGVVINNIFESGINVGFDYTDSGNCIANVTVNANYSNGANIDIEAGNTITATNTINSGANVDYDAGNLVRLTTGFHARPGSTFHAFNDGCGGAMIVSEEDEENTVTEESQQASNLIIDNQ